MIRTGAVLPKSTRKQSTCSMRLDCGKNEPREKALFVILVYLFMYSLFSVWKAQMSGSLPARGGATRAATPLPLKPVRLVELTAQTFQYCTDFARLTVISALKKSVVDP